jgi:glycosyltransferase involved in cell wall biosynthesis
MRFGVDAQRLESSQRLGVGRYIQYMVKYWAEILAPDDHLTLYTRHPVNPSELALTDRLTAEEIRPKLTGMTWQNLVLSREAKNMDSLFCPSYSMPLKFRKPCVVAIHSVNERQAGAHPWWYHLTYKQIYRASARRADRVIVPCEATRQDVIEYYGISGDRIDIVAQGTDDSFKPITDPEVLRATRRTLLGDERPYILFVGKLSQRRNIPLLIEALSIAKRKGSIPHRLLLFGPNHLNLPIQELAHKFGVQDDVVQTDGRVANHQELIAVYSAASLYVFASLYEGFSMTLVEALSCALPVVVADRPALREIAEPCALFVKDPSAEAFADGILKVVQDPVLAKSMSEKSLARSAKFRWRNCAQQTLDVMRRVGGG